MASPRRNGVPTVNRLANIAGRMTVPTAMNMASAVFTASLRSRLKPSRPLFHCRPPARPGRVRRSDFAAQQGVDVAAVLIHAGSLAAVSEAGADTKADIHGTNHGYMHKQAYL